MLADKGAKRVELHVVVGEVGRARFMKAFREVIEKNQDETQLARLQGRMDAFEKMFDSVKTVNRGDIIMLDWLPGAATRISYNGRELGRVEGEDFYQALLSIWIGEHPVMDSLKKEMLGG